MELLLLVWFMCLSGHVDNDVIIQMNIFATFGKNVIAV